MNERLCEEDLLGFLAMFYFACGKMYLKMGVTMEVFFWLELFLDFGRRKKVMANYVEQNLLAEMIDIRWMKESQDEVEVERRKFVESPVKEVQKLLGVC